MLAEQLPIPLQFNHADYDAAGVVASGIDTDQTAADLGVFVVPFKCEVYMAGAHITEACGGDTTTPVVDFDKRPTAGSDTGRGAADIAHLVMATTEAGKFLYDIAGRGTILYPGEEVVVQLVTQPTGTGAAGIFVPVLLVIPIPEMPANIEDMVETA